MKATRTHPRFSPSVNRRLFFFYRRLPPDTQTAAGVLWSADYFDHGKGDVVFLFGRAAKFLHTLND